MRNVSTEFAEKLESTVQTIAEKSNPSTYLRIQRNHVPFTEKQFLERTKVRHASGITDSDVAVCHPYFEKDDETIWVAFIREGKVNVRYADNEELLKQTSWHDYWFTANAEACAIAFDSTVKHDRRSEVWEFITEREPWLFWVDSGCLKAKKCTPLGENILTLALENVTDVSVVRGPSGEYGNWNLGLTVFFVMNGSLYYKQLINGEWYDSELVINNVVTQLDIVKIKAFNTWDHRVGVQILTDDNKLWELYSFTEGIGTRGTEHIALDMLVVGDLQKVRYTTGKTQDEHIEMSISAQGGFTYGLSAVPLSAINIEDEDENWGTIIDITMDYPVTGGNYSEFSLVDSNDVEYLCEEMSIIDGTLIRLVFMDFNAAALAQDITVSYSGNSLMSPATSTDAFEVTFVPVHLVAPQVDPPTYDSASVDSDGMVITMHLTEPIVNDDVSGTEGNFSIGLNEYNWAPGGTLVGTSRTVKSVTDAEGTVVNLQAGTYSDTEAVDGVIRLEVDT